MMHTPPSVQVRFGVENATNQRVTYTDPMAPLRQDYFQFGLRGALLAAACGCRSRA
jgi:hypothetical protein